MIHQYQWAVTDVSSSEDGKAAVDDLCFRLEETFKVFRRLTDQTEAQESTDGTKSLPFVQAALKLAPSKTTNLVKSLQDMRSETQSCFRRLKTAYEHTLWLYDIMFPELARTPTNASTSTTLTVRLKLVDRLKDFQSALGISKRRQGSITVSIVVVI